MQKGFLALMVATALTGCGGGGDSKPAPDRPVEQPPQEQPTEPEQPPEGFQELPEGETPDVWTIPVDKPDPIAHVPVEGEPTPFNPIEFGTPVKDVEQWTKPVDRPDPMAHIPVEPEDPWVYHIEDPDPIAHIPVDDSNPWTKPVDKPDPIAHIPLEGDPIPFNTKPFKVPEGEHPEYYQAPVRNTQCLSVYEQHFYENGTIGENYIVGWFDEEELDSFTGGYQHVSRDICQLINPEYIHGMDDPEEVYKKRRATFIYNSGSGMRRETHAVFNNGTEHGFTEWKLLLNLSELPSHEYLYPQSNPVMFDYLNHNSDELTCKLQGLYNIEVNNEQFPTRDTYLCLNKEYPSPNAALAIWDNIDWMH
ncbi:hypothetical protein [Vibrio harveyi]|uniref:hypothetical protein n=1 Tax=Vibrio harveyi TaxID=669 RepID=UPI0018F1F9A3|nr:hypothetical protein [Vibrio harveyi]